MDCRNTKVAFYATHYGVLNSTTFSPFMGLKLGVKQYGIGYLAIRLWLCQTSGTVRYWSNLISSVQYWSDKERASSDHYMDICMELHSKAFFVSPIISSDELQPRELNRPKKWHRRNTQVTGSRDCFGSIPPSSCWVELTRRSELCVVFSRLLNASHCWAVLLLACLHLPSPRACRCTVGRVKLVCKHVTTHGLQLQDHLENNKAALRK